MKPAQRRKKGHDFERWVAAELRKAGYPDAKRGFQTRGGTAEAADVEGTPFYIECKHRAKLSWNDRCEAWRQAARNCGGAMPIAITKANREKPMVTLAVTFDNPTTLAGTDEHLAHIPWENWLACIRRAVH